MCLFVFDFLDFFTMLFTIISDSAIDESDGRCPRELRRIMGGGANSKERSKEQRGSILRDDADDTTSEVVVGPGDAEIRRNMTGPSSVRR